MDFCRFHGISRKSFYKILKIARQEGQMAALEPRSRRPHSSPTRIDDERVQDALDVREILESCGRDAGPATVFDFMKDLGMDPPSEASLARIFRRAGVARHQPKKKPHSAYQRFEYPAPNACWQLDAMEYHLTRGRKVTIFQLIDDHSRLALASLVAKSENHRDAIKVVSIAIERHGIPQKLLTDNGTALNPTRRGFVGKLVIHASSLGITCITGKPGHPTTQGKVERLHQTLIKYLNAQPDAETIEEFQAQVDAFDHMYNTERRHQALADHQTPPAGLRRHAEGRGTRAPCHTARPHRKGQRARHSPRLDVTPETRLRQTDRHRRPTPPQPRRARRNHLPQRPLPRLATTRRHTRHPHLDAHHRQRLQHRRHPPHHLPHCPTRRQEHETRMVLHRRRPTLQKAEEMTQPSPMS